jgi:L-ribulose-5-phosphate 4-epimerase
MRARRALDRRIVETAARLTAHGLTHGTSGNVSARLPEGLRITPTRVRFDELRPRDLVTTGLDERVTSGRRRPSIELPLHAMAYRVRPDVEAIVHTHSPYATAMSCMRDTEVVMLEEQTYYGTDAVAVAAHAPSGSVLLACNAVAALGSSNAVLLERHGVIAVGASLDEALGVAESVEHQARVAWLAATMGWRAATMTEEAPDAY